MKRIILCLIALLLFTYSTSHFSFLVDENLDGFQHKEEDKSMSSSSQQSVGMLSKLSEFFKGILHKGEEKLSQYHLEEKLKDMTVDELRILATNIENYLLGQSQGSESLKDIEKSSIINFIKDRIMENKGLIMTIIGDLFKEAFIGLSTDGYDMEDSEHKDDKEDIHHYNPIYIGGGILDYLVDMDRSTLIRVALALDNYHRKVTGSPKLGGLHDYIRTLDDHEIRTIIIRYVNIHPEVNDIHIIQEMVGEDITIHRRHHDDDYDAESFLETDTTPIKKEVSDYIMSLSREDLIKHAYAVEKFHKKKFGIEHSIGGIHDFIWKLDDDEIRTYIFGMIEEHYELNKIDVITNICNTMGS
jgi:hypothetical protein